MTRTRILRRAVAGSIVLGLAQGQVLAYIGPGAGFAVAGSFFVLAGSFLLALGAVMLWPFKAVVKMVIRRGKARRVVVTSPHPGPRQGSALRSSRPPARALARVVDGAGRC